MARDTNIDFSIVWGKLERFRESVLGNLVININDEDKDIIFNYLKEKKSEWEFLKSIMNIFLGGE